MWAKCLLAGVALAGALTLYTVALRSALPAPVVSRIATGVDGFELVNTGFGESSRPNFGTSYAIWANYPFFVHDGQRYRRAGAGGVIIEPAAGTRLRYRVEEIGPQSQPRYRRLDLHAAEQCPWFRLSRQDHRGPVRMRHQVCLDVLGADGTHLFQSELTAPVSMRAEARPDRVRVDSAGIALDLVFYDYLKQRDGTSWLPSRRFRAHVSAALPVASTRSAVLAVK